MAVGILSSFSLLVQQDVDFATRYIKSSVKKYGNGRKPREGASLEQCAIWEFCAKLEWGLIVPQSCVYFSQSVLEKNSLSEKTVV